MTVNGNSGSKVNYEPNTMDGPKQDEKHTWTPTAVRINYRRSTEQLSATPNAILTVTSPSLARSMKE